MGRFMSAREVQEHVSLPQASFEFRATVGHRGSLVLRSDHGPLSAQVANSDPAYGRQGALGVAKETFGNRVVEVTPLEGHASDDRARRAAELSQRGKQF